jgi:hypothetical protein
MTNERTTYLVLKDAAGHYYAVPRRTLEGCRVPAERTRAIERALAVDVTAFGVAAFEPRPHPLEGLTLLGQVSLPGPTNSETDDEQQDQRH